jgi:4-amino-4-deoxy-L-arabinose transferase-like glycosyltransferase
MVVLLVAVVARFWGLLFGLPSSYYPDESSVVGDGLHMATTGDLRPAQFLWPTFWIYVVALSIKLGTVAAVLPVDLGPLGPPSLENGLYVYGIARTVTATSGVLTVLALYAVATRWFRRLGLPGAGWLAVLAAGFLALSPLHIQHAHVTSPDVPTTAFLVLAAYCALRILDTGTTRWYVLAGLTLGLSTAAKYPSAMFAAGVVVAHLAQAEFGWGQPLRAIRAMFDWRLWLTGALTVVTFFGTSPYILVDWSRFREDFVSQASRVLQRGPVGEVGISGPFAPVLYVPMALNWGLDTPVALFALAGLGVAVWLGVRRSQDAPDAASMRWALLVMLVFPLLLYVFSWTWQHRFGRYVLPLVPFGCLLAALGLAGLWQMATQHLTPLLAGRLVAALGVAAMLWQADGVVRYDLLLTRQDTRTITAQWLDANMPPGEQALVEWYGPPYRNVRQAGFDLSDRPLDRYIGRTPRFVVTSSFTYDRWLRAPEEFPKRVTFYRGLHEQAQLRYEVRPYPEMEYDPVQEGWDGWHGIPISGDVRPGPVLRVYQVTP